MSGSVSVSVLARFLGGRCDGECKGGERRSGRAVAVKEKEAV